MNKLNHAFSKLSTEASKSILLQKHSALLTSSGHRMTRFTGYNDYVKSHYSNDDPSVHAEDKTLKRFIWHEQTRHSSDAKIRRKLRKMQLFIARLNQNSALDYQFSNSEPCYHCLATLKNYGIKKVVFTSYYGEPHCKKGKSITRLYYF